MTEPEKPVETAVEIKEERAAEAAAIRRRWLTLGEILAVAAVGISALTFWNSYKERSNTEAERAAEAQKADAVASTILLSAKVERDGRVLRLIPSGGQAIQDQSFVFPPSLGVDDVVAMTDPVIDAHWFDDALRKARKAAGKPGESNRIERLPVAVTTRFIAGTRSAPILRSTISAMAWTKAFWTAMSR